MFILLVSKGDDFQIYSYHNKIETEKSKMILFLRLLLSSINVILFSTTRNLLSGKIPLQPHSPMQIRENSWVVKEANSFFKKANNYFLK